VVDFLDTYDVSYIILGQLERIFYTGPGLDKFELYENLLWEEVYQNGNTIIYRKVHYFLHLLQVFIDLLPRFAEYFTDLAVSFTIMRSTDLAVSFTIMRRIIISYCLLSVPDIAGLIREL